MGSGISTISTITRRFRDCIDTWVSMSYRYSLISRKDYMKGIYLFSCIAIHKNFPYLVYQDINGRRDIDGSAFDVDLSQYDYYVATPPCNYYSKINQKRDESEYALKTKDYLPNIIRLLLTFNKPFLVENVLNDNLIPFEFNYDCYVYKIAGHTFWTNIELPDIKSLPFEKASKTTDNTLFRQGGKNVYLVVEYFLRVIHFTKYKVFRNPLDDLIPISNTLEY